MIDRATIRTRWTRFVSTVAITRTVPALPANPIVWAHMLGGKAIVIQAQFTP
jgi:hypothetical protein